MQIPIQKILKQISRSFPYLVILILLIVIFFQRESYSSELKEIEKAKKEILSQNKELEKANIQLTHFIELSLTEREKTIEKHYHTKEVINNKILDYEKNIYDINYADSIGLYISKYRYTPIGISAN